jgi:peroxiredoxin
MRVDGGGVREPNELEQRPQGRREWSGWLRSLVLPLALLAVIVGALFYFQTRSSGSGGDAGFGIVDLPADKNTTGKPAAAEIGRAAPDFLLQDLDGKQVRLSDFQGHALLVNFWASWCLPCREETPGLIAAYEQNRATGLMVLGINLQEANERARQFVNDFSVDYPVVLDRHGQVAKTWRIGGPMQGLPVSYFIDSKGIVRKIVLGPVRSRDLAEGLPLIEAGG